MRVGSDIREVAADEREALIAWLGDSPQTVMSVDRLRRGVGRALVHGPVERPEAAVVQAGRDSVYPAGFGDDPERLWALLGGIERWEAIHVAHALGEAMAAVIERETNRGTELIEEIYYVLDRLVTPVPHPDVRLLDEGDVSLMEAATTSLGMHGWRLGSPGALIANGVAAGAVIDGEPVAVGFTSCRSERHAEVGIVTREDHRNRGLSTAAVALVIAEIQAADLIPVWSTSEENVASQRVGAKLGFVEVSRRVYVNRG